MRRYKIDAAPDVAVAVVKNVAGTGKPAGKFRRLILVAFPETTDYIAVAVVPFAPARGKSSQLIAAVADIPRFGDELDLGDDRILFDDVDERDTPSRVKWDTEDQNQVAIIDGRTYVRAAREAAMRALAAARVEGCSRA